MEKFGIPQKLQTSKCQKKIFFLKKKPNSQLFLRFLAILVTLKLPWCSIKTKNSSSYSIKIKSVWLWFPTSPWMNLWMIFLNSLINSSRELYNSFCGHETFKKSPSQGRVFQLNNLPTIMPYLQGVVRGVAGVARATPIFHVLFHKTLSPQTLKPQRPHALKPLSLKAHKLSHP